MELLARRYRLITPIGEGGMAVVYRAEDTLLGRVVAVKLLRESYSRDESFLRMFVQEARSAASLSHPNIVSIYDTGEDSGQQYIVMEYVPGRDLRAIIAERGPLSVGEAVDYAVQLCAGLAAAHAAGMVHRDVKPHNLLVTPEGTLKILDFGIARALGAASFTKPGEVYGSPHYLSPEQARGQAATPASDIYAAGVVLYEMLTQRRPFEGEHTASILYQQINEPPPPPSQFNPRIPPSLEAIILQALAKTPERRFLDARAMERALRTFSQIAEDRTGAIPLSAVAPSVNINATAPPAVAAPVAAPARRGIDWLLLFLILSTIACIILIAILGVAAYRQYTGSAAAFPAMPTVVTATPAAAAPAVPTAPPPPTATAVPPVPVPKVEGLPADAAKRAIEDAGLVYEQVGEEPNKEVPAGAVSRQLTPPGSPVAPGERVRVVISTGAPKVQVPDVTNVAVAEAEKRLKEAGLTPTRQGAFSRAEVGTVIDQNPAAGTAVISGSAVVITVSEGRAPIQRGVVPDVIGLPIAEAQARIVQAGLINDPYVDYQGRDRVPDNVRNQVCRLCVLSTTPPPGTNVGPGRVVKLGVRAE